MAGDDTCTHCALKAGCAGFCMCSWHQIESLLQTGAEADLCWVCRRNPRQYFEIFDKVEYQEPDGQYSHFELISCKCVDTYVRVKQNANQICWKWRKVNAMQPRCSPVAFRVKPAMLNPQILCVCKTQCSFRS